jgi:hypothetical protein
MPWIKLQEEAVGPHLKKLDKWIKEYENGPAPTARLEPGLPVPPLRKPNTGDDSPAVPGPVPGTSLKRP